MNDAKIMIGFTEKELRILRMGLEQRYDFLVGIGKDASEYVRLDNLITENIAKLMKVNGGE